MTITPYCTLAEAKADLVSDETIQDSTLMALIRQVSARIDNKFWSFAAPFFAPTIATRNIEVDPTRIISWNRTLRLPFPMLSASSVVVNNTTLVVGTNVRLFPPLSMTPYFMLQLINSSFSWYAVAADCSGCGGLQQQFVTLAGTWGWNRDPANMWLAVDAITNVEGITASATSFTVVDVDAANAYGITPRISAGNLLQIDTEWLLVTATSDTTNTVTVLRGVNGSTAAAHLVSAVVSVYQVDDAIKRATLRQVDLQLARQGAYDARDVTGAGVIEFPRDTLLEFNGLLQAFANIG